EYQSPMVHALAHAMNTALGNVGKTVTYVTPLAASPVESMASLRELVQDMEAGKVEMLIMLGGNPVYSAPVDFRFAERLEKVPFRVHGSLYNDETSERCHWHVPLTHSLES